MTNDDHLKHPPRHLSQAYTRLITFDPTQRKSPITSTDHATAGHINTTQMMLYTCGTETHHTRTRLAVNGTRPHCWEFAFQSPNRVCLFSIPCVGQINICVNITGKAASETAGNYIPSVSVTDALLSCC